jgi:predicted RNA-binding protein with PUA-like domain
MVKDKRKCLGCGKPVPNGMRERLTREGWTFMEIIGEGVLTYCSNCGCMTHKDFVEKCHILHDDKVEKNRMEPLVQ